MVVTGEIQLAAQERRIIFISKPVSTNSRQVNIVDRIPRTTEERDNLSRDVLTTWVTASFLDYDIFEKQRETKLYIYFWKRKYKLSDK